MNKYLSLCLVYDMSIVYRPVFRQSSSCLMQPSSCNQHNHHHASKFATQIETLSTCKHWLKFSMNLYCTANLDKWWLPDDRSVGLATRSQIADNQVSRAIDHAWRAYLFFCFVLLCYRLLGLIRIVFFKMRIVLALFLVLLIVQYRRYCNLSISRTINRW